MKTAGIIGGLGPETTSDFYLDVLYSCYRKTKSAKPGIIIASVPLPYHIEEDLITKNTGTERYIPYLVNEAKRLEKAGADFLVMPCNSLHIYIEDIRNAVDISVLSIIDETVDFLKKNNLKKVGVLSTTATVQNKLYETSFEQKGIDYFIPEDFQQKKIDRIIMNILSGLRMNSDREELERIIGGFENKNVDCVTLACTDLQVIRPEHAHVKIYDTMNILARATVDEILNKR